MRLMAVFALVALLAFNGPQAAMAQKVYRISALVASDQFLPTFEGFKKKMAELGYIDGKNIQYDLHNAHGDAETLKTLAKKMVQDKPSLIVTSSTTATVPVAKATEGTNLPVVFLSAGNPLRFAKSYSSSGNNLTGISTSTIDITGKRMELLKELAPGIRKVISLHNPKGANYEANLRATREAAEKLGFQLVEINIGGGDELVKRAKELLSRKLGDGVILPPDALINAVTEEIAPNMIAERLPSISPNIEDVRRGSLAAYAADYFALGQQGAVLVDKILRGARPADLPIEQPFQLRLVINLKTAKAIGLKVPREILVRADEVIE